MQFRGARYLHVLVPCPLGWGSKSSETIQVARLATESGYFPVFEAERGALVAATPIRRRVPVDEYLRRQGRYAHLFSPTLRSDIISKIQEQADRNIERFGLVAGFAPLSAEGEAS
jgi:pyruvate ferredoxin oxidoreductase beta subunit